MCLYNLLSYIYSAKNRYDKTLNEYCTNRPNIKNDDIYLVFKK